MIKKPKHATIRIDTPTNSTIITHITGFALCKTKDIMSTIFTPLYLKKQVDLVGLPSSHLWYLILCLILTACGSADPEPEKLPTFETRKPYESKLTTAPKCPIADADGNYDMTGLSEAEIIHIMQYGCDNQKPNGYKSPYAYNEPSYDAYEYDAPPPPPSEQFSDEELPDFDMFITP